MYNFKQLPRLVASLAACGLVASMASAQDTVPPAVPPPSEVSPTAPDELTPTEPVMPETSPGSMSEPPPPATATSNTHFTMANPEPMVDETSRLTFPNRPLLATSSMLFVSSYVPTVIFQAVKERNEDLYIPVAGPWLDLAKGDDGRLAQAVLAADGVVQGLGALGVFASLVIPEKRTRGWYLIGGSRNAFNLAPARLARSSVGLLAQGTF